jgi:hypothetical protein
MDLLSISSLSAGARPIKSTNRRAFANHYAVEVRQSQAA